MDSCQLGQKMHNSSVSVRACSPTKMRPVHIKKSHSSTPSPEIVASKMTPAIGISSGENQLSQNSPQPHSGSMSRNRVGHCTSPPEHRSESKRRRLNSSPVRPWKSPSPPTAAGSIVVSTGESSASQTGPSLLRHISVIRETPAILKPQVMAPSPYHAHHYHQLVDQYAAAYHLYKASPNQSQISAQPGPVGPSNPNSHSAHHWGAYG